MGSTDLLSTRSLCVRRRERILIDKLDIDIAPNQCWVILGRNGCGKSSLLKTLAAVEPINSGSIDLDQQTLSAWTPKQRATRIGLVFQHSHAGFHSTTLQMALSGNYPHRAAWGYESVQEVQQAQQALQAVGLTDLATQPLESLSGGELRRAEIARLLVQSPKIAMLDEPLNHLDIAQQISILKHLRSAFCTASKALVLVLHDINLARHVATHLLLLHGNGEWQAGSVASLGNAATLSKLFAYPLRESSGSGQTLEIDPEALI